MDLLQFNIDNRTNLYFGKYKYRAQCHVPGINYTYYISSIDEFDKKIKKVKSNINSSIINQLNFGYTFGRGRLIDIENIDASKIEKFLHWKINKKSADNYIFRIQGSQISFFSNDKELLKTLIELDEDTKFTESIVKNNNVMYFKNEPKYKYRTFFKGKKYSIEFPEQVFNLTDIYKDNLKFSPGMLRNLKKRLNYRYMHTSYYVDYNDEGMLTILSIWLGDHLGKTFSLLKEN